MKSIVKILLFFIFTPIILSCSGYGKKLEFNNTEVYYTKEVFKEEAQKLGKFLVRSEFADGKEKSVQLTKNKETNHYIFRMVTNPEAAKNKAYEILFKAVAIQISDSVFNKAPVDFHVCNNTFKTLKELPFKTTTNDN
ncbi:MAG: hypothetical protein HWD85_09815 [Flavobacteriaceae bacterium]|nr:hypothetical protein [Flavobacteriaceae bacterium]